MLISTVYFQVSDLIAELASAAAAEKGFTFEEGIEERLCAYSRAVAHFPTAVKEVGLESRVSSLKSQVSYQCSAAFILWINPKI